METSRAGDSNRGRSLLANALFLAILFPFVSPLPITADTQPVALILAVAMLFVEVLYGRRFTWRELALIGFPLASLAYLNPAVSPLIPAALGKYVALFAGGVVYVVARDHFCRFRPGVFKAAVVAYFVYTLLLLARPDTFLRLQGHFVRGINAEAENPFGFRGVLTFATEPGLLGGLLIFHLFMLDYYRRAEAFSRRTYWMLFGMLGFMIVATKSGTGYLYLLLYAGYMLAPRPKLAIKIGVGIAALGLIALKSGRLESLPGLGRGVQVLQNLANMSLLAVDTSTLGRLNDFSVGIVSLFHFPFGNGANGVGEATAWLNTHYTYLHQYNGYGPIGLVSGFAYCIVAYGVFGLGYLAYVYLITSRAPLGNRLFSFVYLGFSYSPAFPPLWVLLAEPPARTALPNVPAAPAETTVPPSTVTVDSPSTPSAV